MRILHLTDRVSDRGGAHVHLAAVVRVQNATDEVRVLAGTVEGQALPCPVEVANGLDARGEAPVALAGAVSAFRPDVLHVHTVVNPEALSWAADHGAVMTVQDHRVFCPARGKWTAEGRVCTETMARSACRACFEDEAYFDEVLGLTERRLRAVARMRALVVLSAYMRGQLVAAGLAPGRVQVIPPFVADLALDTPDGPPCVLFVGRLTETKGVWDALEAWRRSGIDLPLVFAGTGPARDALQRAGATVLGWVGRDRLGALYARARALVMPSRWQEPFGIAGLEAATLGVPVAAWDSGGIREWHRDPDLIAAWGDVDGLARALRAAVTRRARPPEGFARGPLMARLRRVYDGGGGDSSSPAGGTDPPSEGGGGSGVGA